jgi:hypothetical protein
MLLTHHTHIPETGERVNNINIQSIPLPHPYTRKGGKSYQHKYTVKPSSTPIYQKRGRELTT